MPVDPGRYTRLIGLQVDDASRYAEYRARMTPLLHARGGAKLVGWEEQVSYHFRETEPALASSGPLARPITEND